MTVTTTAPHSLVLNQAVLIRGVADSSFNGAFTVATIPTANTFTYQQSGANGSSGGGTASYATPVATATLVATTRGVSVNPETGLALLGDPTAFSVSFFSLLDQTVRSLTLPAAGVTGVAFQPLTNTGIVVNRNTNQATIIDPRTPATLGTLAVGTSPVAVAVDPGSNLAIVANEGSDNLTVISLGSIRSLHLLQVTIPAARQLAPNMTLSSATPTDLPLILVGKGFPGGVAVRLDGVALPAPSSVTDRQITVTVPASFLASPRRYALDVVAGGAQSNAAPFTVVQSVDVTSTGCAQPFPRAVAIDAQRDLAVVTNRNCDNVSLIGLSSGTVNQTITVGDDPRGVAVNSRLGRAVVTNRGGGTASAIDLNAGTVTATVTVGGEPIGVAIDPDTGRAFVLNSASNSVSTFLATDTTSTSVTGTLDRRPLAIAIDAARRVAVVAHAQDNNLAILDLNLDPPAIRSRIGGAQVPTAVAFDPISRLFVGNSSLGNQLFLVDPDTSQLTPAQVGINPTSIGLNAQSSTLVTVNTASKTMSVMDVIGRTVRHILSLPGSQQFSIEIHPRTNLAVIADENNQRVLLLPLPQ